jgi:hypothetical protein
VLCERKAVITRAERDLGQDIDNSKKVAEICKMKDRLERRQIEDLGSNAVEGSLEGMGRSTVEQIRERTLREGPRK